MGYYICAIIKDEQRYLEEWIAYHLSIGFTRIFLYEDFTSTSHNEITDKYENVELHKMSEIGSCKPNRVGRQICVYNNFISKYNDGWCLFIDIDEYFRLEDGLSLESFLDKFSDKVGICIWWKCYGANGHVKSPNLSVQEAYSSDYLQYFNPYWQFKSFVNLKEASKYVSEQSNFINCHYHKRIVTTLGEKCDFRQEKNKKLKTYNLAWIDHYITKSWEDYLFRLKRGNITKGLRNVDYFFRLNKSMERMKEELTKSLDISEFKTL